MPAWPPGGLALDHDRAQPFRRAVDRGGEAGRAAAHHHEVVKGRLGRPGAAAAIRELADGRTHEPPAVGQDDQRQRVAVVGERQDVLRLLVALHVEPSIGHMVAREEIADLEAALGPAVIDHGDAFEGRAVAGLPVLQQVIERRIEQLLRRLPGLHQVIVELHLVDRADGDVAVGIGGQQHALRRREQRRRLGQELDAGHLRHALVGEEEGERLVAQLERADDLQRLAAGCRGQDPIVPAKWSLRSRATARSTSGSSSTARMAGFAMLPRSRSAVMPRRMAAGLPSGQHSGRLA